jgi:aminoglycoside phosphotransferase (APT) family kinase protein
VAGVTAPRAAELRVADLRRLAGGSSRETWAFTLERGGEGRVTREALVLRRDPPGRAGEGDRGLELRVVRAAFEAGVPVPRPRAGCADPAVLGTPFYVMDFVAGEALPRRLLRDPEYAAARERLIPQLAAILARIHRVDPDAAELRGLAPMAEGEYPARAEVEALAAEMRRVAPEPHPALDLAARWLAERAPRRGRRALVHGDFRLGNVLCDAEGAVAVLDWELCHVGDPAEDLGWLCTRAWRFGSDHLPAAGLGTREQLLDAYLAAGGSGVDLERLRFYEALGSFKVAVVFLRQCHVHLSGRLRSLELAALGRRTAEAEEELVRLMQEDAL